MRNFAKLREHRHLLHECFVLFRLVFLVKEVEPLDVRRILDDSGQLALTTWCTLATNRAVIALLLELAVYHVTIFIAAVVGFSAHHVNFVLDDFCKRFNFKSIEVYPALKKLEEFGLLEFNESFYRPSLLHFSFDKKKLYEFQVAHARFDLLIKALLRLYGGELFSDFTPISESQIALMVKQTIGTVKLELDQLHNLEVVVYEPVNESPKITFVLARQDADRLPIDK